MKCFDKVRINPLQQKIKRAGLYAIQFFQWQVKADGSNR